MVVIGIQGYLRYEIVVTNYAEEEINQAQVILHQSYVLTISIWFCGGF